MKMINMFGGSLLLITGILMITNQLQALGYYILNTFPFQTESKCKIWTQIFVTINCDTVVYAVKIMFIIGGH